MTSGILITRTSNALRGELLTQCKFSLPGDKSLSHRAALLGAMAEGESHFENFQVSGVTQALLESLEKIGVKWELHGHFLIVAGIGLNPEQYREKFLSPVHLNCGNSATTLRLLAGALSAWRISAVLDGSPGLRRRPMDRIVKPLREMGMEIESSDGCAPLILRASERPLMGIRYHLPVASAQVKSCLLLAGLTAVGETVLIEPGPSRDHTERMLKGMGVEIERMLNTSKSNSHQSFLTRLAPPPSGALKPLKMKLPGDISASAFLIVAALIVPDSHILLPSIGLNPTRMGLIDVLQKMGADIQISNQSMQGGEPIGDLDIRYSDLHAVQVNGEQVVRMIDEFPIFAVAAAFANGKTIVSDALELRHKESDRISALSRELSSIGVQITEQPDGFEVIGGSILRGGEVNPHRDHRLAMSLAIAGLASQKPVIVQDANIIAESFPNFLDILNYLGASVSYE
jgi:3-phosphoshikimate 1-carboxyvinyltransferase